MNAHRFERQDGEPLITHRRLIDVVLIAFLASLLFLPRAGASGEVVPLFDEPLSDGAPTERIMPVGDSITRGDFGYQAYRGALIEMLQGRGHHARFVGPYSNGARPEWAWWSKRHAAWGGRRYDQIAQLLQAQIESYRPDIILLMAGSNDVRVGTPISDLQDSLREIMETAAAHDLWLFVSATLPRYERPDDRGSVEAVNVGLRSVVEDEGRCKTLWVTHADFRLHDTVDGVHPNAGGEIKVAANFARALESASCPVDIE